MTEKILVRNMTNSPRLSREQALNAARVMFARFQWPEHLDALEKGRTGPKRRVPFRALIIGMLYYCLMYSRQDVHLSKIADELEQLTSAQKQLLGLIGGVTKKNLWLTFDSLVKSLPDAPESHDHPLVDETTGEIPPCGHSCQSISTTVDAFVNHLIGASVADVAPDTGEYAIDGTAFRTHAKLLRSELSENEVDAIDSTTNRAARRKAGPRVRHTKDPDALAGYQTPSNGNKGTTFVGYEAHLVTTMPQQGHSSGPSLIRALILSSAGESKAVAGLACLDNLRKVGRITIDANGERRRTPILVKVLAADRGYSALRAETWQLPLWQDGVDQVFDLRENQRGVRPGPIHGTVYIDGGLFSNAVPEHLRNLPKPNPIGATETAKLNRTALFDQRAAYAWSPHSARNPNNGHQRMKGPVEANRLRCPNAPRSLRKKASLPLTTCTTTPCGCSGTTTVTPDDNAREYQWPLYGTTDWLARYGKRTAIESVNAEVKYHRGRLSRSFVRVFTRVRHALLIAANFAAVNYHIVRDWYFKRNQQNPWGGEDWDFGEKPRQRRTPRTTALHMRTGRKRSKHQPPQ